MSQLRQGFKRKTISRLRMKSDTPLKVWRVSTKIRVIDMELGIADLRTVHRAWTVMEEVPVLTTSIAIGVVQYRSWLIKVVVDSSRLIKILCRAPLRIQIWRKNFEKTPWFCTEETKRAKKEPSKSSKDKTRKKKDLLSKLFCQRPDSCSCHLKSVKLSENCLLGRNT